MPTAIGAIWIFGGACDAWINRKNKKYFVWHRYAIALLAGLFIVLVTLPPSAADRTRNARQRCKCVDDTTWGMGEHLKYPQDSK